VPDRRIAFPTTVRTWQDYVSRLHSSLGQARSDQFFLADAFGRYGDALAPGPGEPYDIEMVVDFEVKGRRLVLVIDEAPVPAPDIQGDGEVNGVVL
jgi:hypothetical protein